MSRKKLYAESLNQCSCDILFQRLKTYFRDAMVFSLETLKSTDASTIDEFLGEKCGKDHSRVISYEHSIEVAE